VPQNNERVKSYLNNGLNGGGRIEALKNKELMDIPKLYVGAMNDALFIIDEQPGPCPLDYVNPRAHKDCNTIARVEYNPELANELVDAWNAVLKKYDISYGITPTPRNPITR